MEIDGEEEKERVWRLYQNSESFDRATLDIHGEKSQVIIIERLVIFLQKPISKVTDF